MAEKKPKPVSKPQHRTASPYSRSKAQMVEQSHHDIIVDRLISALSPIKAYRAQQPVSKGKKSNKRKRGTTADSTQPVAPENEENKQSNSPPSVINQVLLGFNNVTRHLEELSAFSADSTKALKPAEGIGQPPARQHVAVVFLLHPLDDLIYSHLPTLCYTASLAQAERPATRLVLLDPATEKRVADAVGLPRVSLLGIVEREDGVLPELVELAEYVSEHVKPVEVPWLKDAEEGKWIGTKIEPR